ncbi:hypothetical protein EJB05_52584, partial [Eragrostis curvula]
LFPASGRSPATDALAVLAVALLSAVSGRPVAGFVDGPQTELVVPAALCLSSPQCCAACVLAQFMTVVMKDLGTNYWATAFLLQVKIHVSSIGVIS